MSVSKTLLGRTCTIRWAETDKDRGTIVAVEYDQGRDEHAGFRVLVEVHLSAGSKLQEVGYVDITIDQSE